MERKHKKDGIRSQYFFKTNVDGGAAIKMTSGPLNPTDALYFPNISISEDENLHLDDTRPDPVGLPKTRMRPQKPKNPFTPRLKPPVWPWVAVGVVVGALGLSVVLRKDIAALYLTSWLKAEGIQARVKISKLDLDHTQGAILIGAEARPELKINTFALDYRLTPFAPKSQGFVQLKSVRLTGLTAAFALKGAQTHFGSMNALVQKALKAPATGTPIETIIVEDANFRVSTDYGQVRAKGGLSLKQGRLNFLSLTLPPAHLNGPLGEGALLSGHIRAEALKGVQGLKIEGDLAADTLIFHQDDRNVAEDADGRAHNSLAEAVVLSFDGLVPYGVSSKPQQGFEALKGAFSGQVAVRAQGLHGEDADIEGLEGHIRLKGHLLGSASELAYEGQLSLLGRADSVKSGDLDSQGLRLEGPSLKLHTQISPTGLKYRISGPMSGHVAALRQADIFVQNAELALSDFSLDQSESGLISDFEGVAYMPRAGMGELSFDTLNLDMTGSVRPAEEGSVIDLALNAQSDAAHYTGLRAMAEGRDTPVPRDSDHPRDAIITLDRELGRFGLRARGLKLNLRSHPRLRPPSITIGLKEDITATFADGGVLRLTAPGTKTIISESRGGHFVAELSGGDLPQARIEITQLKFSDANRYDIVSGHFVAQGLADLTPARGVGLAAEGRFATDTELNLNIDLDGAAHITAEQVTLGDRLEQVKLDLYQTGAHFIRLSPNGFFLNGHFANASLSAPHEQVAISDGTGAITMAPKGASKDSTLKIDLTRALIVDSVADPVKRFYPLTIAGTLNQDPLSANGQFSLSSTKFIDAAGLGAKVANIELLHAMGSGEGTMKISTGDLNFVKGGLQPAALTPAVEGLMGNDTTGKVSFTGGFSWTKDKAASSGVLRIENMNFKAATHVVKGFEGEVLFDSLTPLHSPEGQTFKVASILAGMPLSDVRARLQFDNDHINVAHLTVQTEGGEARLAPMTYALEAKTAQSGEIQFDHLNLGTIIKGTDLGKSMIFDGLVTGRLPFSLHGSKFMIFDGTVIADGPGRISIPRGGVTNLDGGTALAEVTDGAKPIEKVAPQQVGISDLAYQAMENLAFESLDGNINSLPNGILDINFHIKGYFDPPQKQQTQVSLFDFITGKWVDKPIKLQSGAKIDLYLNVPLNLDTILQDLEQLNRHSAVKPSV